MFINSSPTMRCHQFKWVPSTTCLNRYFGNLCTVIRGTHIFPHCSLNSNILRFASPQICVSAQFEALKWVLNYFLGHTQTSEKESLVQSKSLFARLSLMVGILYAVCTLWWTTNIYSRPCRLGLSGLILVCFHIIVVQVVVRLVGCNCKVIGLRWVCFVMVLWRWAVWGSHSCSGFRRSGHSAGKDVHYMVTPLNLIRRIHIDFGS